jgi:butyryl-CoA dehydrogenase
METFRERVAAITGAAGGIGRALALELADRGCDVALADVDQEGLEATAETVRGRGARVLTTSLDVSEREAVYEWADEVVEHFGRVHAIFNNAGVSLSAPVEEMEWEDFEWLMSINFWGVTYGTKAFLPHLREAGEGHVVNISSVFGLMSSPTQSAYNASKFAVRGFTESLRAELEIDEAPIEATTVHPGGIQTDIVRNSRMSGTERLGRSADAIVREFEEEIARTSPEEAARQIVEGVQSGRRRILVGPDAKLFDVLQRLLPSKYLDLLASLIRRRWRDG